MSGVRLYFRYMGLVLRSAMQYRASFLLTLLGQALIPFTVFAGMLLLFQRFHVLGEWTVDEVMLCFACIHLSFAVSECFARGFDRFSQVVSQGEFDRVLVRPRGTVLQVLGARFEFSRIGRFALSMVILILSLVRLQLVLTPLKLLTVTLMVLCGALIFSGIFMLAATLCFWTIERLEVANIFTDGGREMSQYPLNIYPKAIMRFFTFCDSVWNRQLSAAPMAPGAPGQPGLACVDALVGTVVPGSLYLVVAGWGAQVSVGGKLKRCVPRSAAFGVRNVPMSETVCGRNGDRWRRICETCSGCAFLPWTPRCRDFPRCPGLEHPPAVFGPHGIRVV